jgi:putative DNA primase/helicase
MKRILSHLMKTARERSAGFAEIYLQEPDFADFIARASGGLIRHSSSWGWLVYDRQTGVFIHDDRAGKIVGLYIEEMAKQLIKSATEVQDYEHRDAVIKFGCKILSAKGVRNIEKLLIIREPLAVRADAFDQSPWLLNCQGVAVDLRTGERRPACPDNLFMKCAGFKPLDCSFAEAVARAPVFVRFMMDITCKNAALAEYLLYFLGYSLTAEMKEECYLNFYGARGRNGKGTLMDTLRSVWGDYILEAPDSVVLKIQDTSRFDDSAIIGARLILKGDIPEGAWLNNKNIKRITGQDTLHAEKKYHDSFDFKPKCKIILSSNYRIRLSETGGSMEERIRLIPFVASFAANPDRNMREKLISEGPAILTILIDYARRWYERRLPDCYIVKKASTEYLFDEDAVRQFIAEKCVRGDGESVPRENLYTAFCSWLSGKPPSAKSFKDKMAARGYECRKERSRNENYNKSCFFGLRLLREGEEKPPEQADLFKDGEEAGQIPEFASSASRNKPLFQQFSMRDDYSKVLQNTPFSGRTGRSEEQEAAGPSPEDDIWRNPFEGEEG